MKSNVSDKEKFFYPHNHYHGEVTPETIAFNSNFQEFAQKVGYITSLETSGKIPPQTAYKQIKALWDKLQRNTKGLRTSGNSFFPRPEKRGLKLQELCEKLGLNYKQVALSANQQGIGTHEYIQKITGWVLRQELYYPHD
ncbi:MAG: hypothetical protein AAF378_09090 [Cyanobacteria bacterium P01_A01_bin.84]